MFTILVFKTLIYTKILNFHLGCSSYTTKLTKDNNGDWRVVLTIRIKQGLKMIFYNSIHVLLILFLGWFFSPFFLSLAVNLSLSTSLFYSLSPYFHSSHSSFTLASYGWNAREHFVENFVKEGVAKGCLGWQ